MSSEQINHPIKTTFILSDLTGTSLPQLAFQIQRERQHKAETLKGDDRKVITQRYEFIPS
jgi:hypothetical protein